VKQTAVLTIAVLAFFLLLGGIAEAVAPSDYLPGEGGSYYTWVNTGQPCAPYATWHYQLYWASWGPVPTGEWACF